MMPLVFKKDRYFSEIITAEALVDDSKFLKREFVKNVISPLCALLNVATRSIVQFASPTSSAPMCCAKSPSLCTKRPFHISI